jgi:hypothetical protein
VHPNVGIVDLTIQPCYICPEPLLKASTETASALFPKIRFRHMATEETDVVGLCAGEVCRVDLSPKTAYEAYQRYIVSHTPMVVLHRQAVDSEMQQ